MVFWLILVAIPFLKYSYYPNLEKKPRHTMGWTPENDQEILREGMNTSNTWSIYHNA